MRKPYYKDSHQAWFADIHGKTTRLTDRCAKDNESKTAAVKRWHELTAAEQPAGPDITCTAIIARFLEWSKANKADATHGFYWTHLTSFGDFIGTKRVRDVTPTHVEKWLGTKGKPRKDKNGKDTAGVSYAGRSDTYRANACRALARLFNWGVKMRLIPSSPISGYERPSYQPRETYVSPEEWDKLKACITDDSFRDIAMFLALRAAGPKRHESSRQQIGTASER